MKTTIKTSFMFGIILALAIISFAGFTQSDIDYGYNIEDNLNELIKK